jgi:hypothetical protein
MGSNGEPADGFTLAEGNGMPPAAARKRENRALHTHARTLLEPQAVLAFRCECKHPLCRDFMVLTLAEYGAASEGQRAVVALRHGGVDGRDVVERTSRFCIVEEARVAL